MRWLLPLLSVGVLAACGLSADAETTENGAGGFDTGGGSQSGGFVPDTPTVDTVGPELETDQRLLAGEWDDSLNFAPWYTDFRDQYLTYRDDPNVDVTGRIIVHVESEQGAPIPNARVSLPGEGPNGLVSLGLTTPSGQVQYFPLHDPADPAEAGSLFTVQIAGQPTQDIPAELVDDDELKLVVPAFDPALPTQLDIALVLDTTLSLEDEVQYLKSTLGQLDSDVGNAF
ncbi:MAG TPA: hypothetical protein ENK57_12460, partial [Polyangiaceae bacterium]|nr:hypothetical protein [Polyangiaceae bacterium]